MTVTSASAGERSRPSKPASAPGRFDAWLRRLGHRLETVDEAVESRLPFWRRLPFWLPFAVYAISRVYVLISAATLSPLQIALPLGTEFIRIMYPIPADPGYLLAMTNWDGQWYRVIAEEGYPAVLPLDDEGRVDMNPWAFFPLFPLLSGAIMKVTGLSFVVVGPLLSTLIGFPAMHYLFKLVDQAVGRWEAIVAVVATCFFIASPAFSASYTESTALLGVVAVLLLLRARRYGWVVLALLALALSRNVVMAMAPVILTHAVVRWRAGDEGHEPVRFRWGMAALALYAALLTFLWPTIARVATGTTDAYNQTMMAWSIQTRVKLDEWWSLMYDYAGVMGQAAGIALVAAFAWLMLSRLSWSWGPEIWGWAGAYPAYILLVSSPTPSRVRYAMLAFPFTLVIAAVLRAHWWERWRYLLLGGVVVLGAAQMWWWTENYLIVGNLTDDLYP